MEITKISKTNSNEKYFSLRSTIPNKMVKYLKVGIADHLKWEINEKGEVVVSKQDG